MGHHVTRRTTTTGGPRFDALHFSKLCGRLWANLRRCAGFNVQYFSVIEAQQRLAPHLHAAARGAIPRAVLRQVVEATYYTLWWPQFDTPIYVERIPVWTGTDYIDPDTGEVLPTWVEALDQAENAPDAKPAHVMRFGPQLDLQGVIPEHADRAIRYLTSRSWARPRHWPGMRPGPGWSGKTVAQHKADRLTPGSSSYPPP